MIGKSEEEAKAALESAGFEVEVESGEDSAKSDGVVLKQSITDKADEGATVTITVNKLPEEHTVTISVNASAYITSSESSTSDEQTSSTKKSSVPVEIYVDNARITPNGGITATKENPTVTQTWKTSGNKKIRVVIDGTTLPEKTINFSDGDQTVSF